MLKEVSIHNFKGLEYCVTDNIGRVNVFVGKNNSGKSSILHLLAILGDIFGNGNKLPSIVQEGQKYSFIKNPNELFPEKQLFKVNLKFNFTGDTTTSMSCSPENRLTFNVRYPDYSTAHNAEELVKNFFKSIYIEPNLDIRHRGDKATSTQVLSDFEVGHYSNHNALQLLHAIRVASKANHPNFNLSDYLELIETIKKYFPEITYIDADIDMENRPTILYQEGDIDKLLDIRHVGTGVKSFLDILIKTTASKSNIILLDEPERGLHPDQQRNLMEFLIRFSGQENKQVFITTHSPVIFNYAEDVSYFRVHKESKKRVVTHIPSSAIHTVYSDLGIRPSDLFNTDICVLVEGVNDVIFFSHIYEKFYKDEFGNCSVTFQQYGGGSALAILTDLDIKNITPSQKYCLWIHDRDASHNEEPNKNAITFKNKLEKQGHICIILNKREIEFYFPIQVHLEVQENNSEKEKIASEFYHGPQSMGYKKALGKGLIEVPLPEGDVKKLLLNYLSEQSNIDLETIDTITKIRIPRKKLIDISIPSGGTLKKLLQKHLTEKNDVDSEIINIFESILVPWKNEILGNEG